MKKIIVASVMSFALLASTAVMAQDKKECCKAKTECSKSKKGDASKKKSCCSDKKETKK